MVSILRRFYFRSISQCYLHLLKQCWVADLPRIDTFSILLYYKVKVFFGQMHLITIHNPFKFITINKPRILQILIKYHSLYLIYIQFNPAFPPVIDFIKHPHFMNLVYPILTEINNFLFFVFQEFVRECFPNFKVRRLTFIYWSPSIQQIRIPNQILPWFHLLFLTTHQ